MPRTRRPQANLADEYWVSVGNDYLFRNLAQIVDECVDGNGGCGHCEALKRCDKWWRERVCGVNTPVPMKAAQFEARCQEFQELRGRE